MPLETGIEVTKFLTLSLRESISNGCRNTNLLLHQVLGCPVAAEPRLRRRARPPGPASIAAARPRRPPPPPAPAPLPRPPPRPPPGPHPPAGAAPPALDEGQAGGGQAG